MGSPAGSSSQRSSHQDIRLPSTVRPQDPWPVMGSVGRHRLANVCSRCRSIIFESQHQEDPRLWTALPVTTRHPTQPVTSQDEDHVIAILTRPDHTCIVSCLRLRPQDATRPFACVDSPHVRAIFILQASFPHHTSWACFSSATLFFLVRPYRTSQPRTETRDVSSYKYSFPRA